MKKHNLLKSLILVISVLFGTVEAFATAEATGTLSVSSLPTVILDTENTSDYKVINSENGQHSGLKASFTLQTNGADDSYMYIFGSKIVAEGNVEVSAFSADGRYLLFARSLEEEHYPTLDAINDAKNGGNNNRNVIAYPCTVEIDSPMTVDFQNGVSVEGKNVDCYVVNVNTGYEGTLVNTIDGVPLSGTYSPAQDMAGSYKAVVYFTAISNK